MISLIHDETVKFLQLHRLPARLTVAQVAALLGFQPVDISVLAEKKLLRPLGRPVRNAVKYFARDEVEQLARNRDWLSKATQSLYDHWAKRNRRLQKIDSSEEPEAG